MVTNEGAAAKIPNGARVEIYASVGDRYRIEYGEEEGLAQTHNFTSIHTTTKMERPMSRGVCCPHGHYKLDGHAQADAMIRGYVNMYHMEEDDKVIAQIKDGDQVDIHASVGAEYKIR